MTALLPGFTNNDSYPETHFGCGIISNHAQREILFGSFMFILFVRAGSTPPIQRFRSLAHNLLGIVTEKANTCPCPSLVESGMDFLGGQAMLRGSLWIIFIILVIGISTGKPTTFGIFWLCSERERRHPQVLACFLVGLPHSSEVPPNKSPKSQCHTQHLIPCSLPSGDPLAPLRDWFKDVQSTLHGRGSNLGGTWVVPETYGFVWKCWVNIPNEIAIFHT